jgi:hypothetical protein
MSDTKQFRIIIAPRGWVWVGQYSMDGDMVVLSRARNVRTWGTTDGLLELASDGPTKATELDGKKGGTVRFHVLAVQQIEANPEKWSEVLK